MRADPDTPFKMLPRGTRSELVWHVANAMCAYTSPLRVVGDIMHHVEHIQIGIVVPTTKDVDVVLADLQRMVMCGEIEGNRVVAPRAGMPLREDRGYTKETVVWAANDTHMPGCKVDLAMVFGKCDVADHILQSLPYYRTPFLFKAYESG